MNNSSKKALPVKIREANQEDVGFIFNSWLRSYKPSFFSRLIENRIYFENHHKLLERLAKTSRFVIACAEEDPTQIYGYICFEKIQDVLTIHYVYVKHWFRRMGIAKLLMKEAGHDAASASCTTHITRIAEKPAIKYSIIYHPYLLFNPDEHKVEATDSDDKIVAMALSKKEIEEGMKNESEYD